MKLLYCELCNDVFNLTEKVKKCSCKKSFGSIAKDGVAMYGGDDAKVLSLGELLLLNIADPEAIKIEKEQKKKLENQNRIIAAKVLNYLNEKAGTSYIVNFIKAPAHFEIIIARINDGFEYQDFVSVIDKKCNHWLHDQNMYKNLRPSTLFSKNNFANYIGELSNAKDNTPIQQSDNTTQQSVNNKHRQSSFDGFATAVNAAKGISFDAGRKDG